MFDLVLFRRPQLDLSALSSIDLSGLVRSINVIADVDVTSAVEAIDLHAELDTLVNAAVAKALAPSEN